MAHESLTGPSATSLSGRDVDREKENENEDSNLEERLEEQRQLRERSAERYVYSVKTHVVAELYADSIKCLEPSTYLNDEVVNFYLAYLLHECCPSDVAKKFHIFDNICHKILQETFPDKKKVDATKWRQLNKWFNGIDLFEKDYLIFPICHEDHWYAVIVCHPLEVRDCVEDPPPKPNQSSDSRNRPVPGVIVMDSLNLKKSMLSKEIRDFLDFEWRTRLTVIKDFHWTNLEEFHPKLPRQTNAYDCGIFMLAYLRAFIQQPDKFYRYVRKSKADALCEMVSEALVDCSRESIKSLINRVCKLTKPAQRSE